MVLPTQGRSEERTSEILKMAFLAGWSAADEAHLPRFPEVICNWVRADFVRLSITSREPRWIRTYAHPPRPDQGLVEEAPKYTEFSSYKFKRPLSEELTLCLTAHAGVCGFTPGQIQILDLAAPIIHAAIECLFVTQKDRVALGKPFSELTDREWLVCQELSDPESEKEIAARLVISPFTLHMYVRNIYRKLRVNNRLAVVQRLQGARAQCRMDFLDRVIGLSAATLAAKAGVQSVAAPSFGDRPAEMDRDERVA